MPRGCVIIHILVEIKIPKKKGPSSRRTFFIYALIRIDI